MSLRALLFTLPALLSAGAAAAQGLPTSQPAQITIYRESVKLGRGAEHARIESGWPAAFARAKSPVYYRAVTSITGANEAWFLTPFASNAAFADEMRLEESDTALAAEMERLGRADAEVLTDSRTIQAVGRPDLGHGGFPDPNRQRFWQITVYRVRPGHGAGFEAAAKAFGAATERTVPGYSYRVYQVTAGMPEPTYLVFTTVESYAQFDALTANSLRIFQAFTPDELATINKSLSDDVITSETNRYRLDPRMSYVPAETRAMDPAFWMPRRP